MKQALAGPFDYSDAYGVEEYLSEMFIAATSEITVPSRNKVMLS